MNPLDPSNLVAVFQGRYDATEPDTCYFAASFNGGNTWAVEGSVQLKYAGDYCGDPSLTVDSLDNFYYSFLEYNLNTFAFSLRIAKSTDGGRTFSPALLAVEQIPGDLESLSPDKPLISADAWPSSPFRDTLYQGFADFSGDGRPKIGVVLSRDGGATWSAPQLVAVPARNERPTLNRNCTVPTAGPDGTAYLFYSEYPETEVMGALSIRFTKSTDGGVTWTPPTDVPA